MPISGHKTKADLRDANHMDADQINRKLKEDRISRILGSLVPR